MKKRIRMLSFFLLSCMISTGCGSSKSQETNNHSPNEQAVRQAALDYIEGWYQGDAERMAKALHPNLVKRRINGDSIKELDYDTMISFTKKGGGKHVPKDSYTIEVRIQSIDKNIASVITLSEYIDYLHLVKVDNQWKILNVLWDHNK